MEVGETTFNGFQKVDSLGWVLFENGESRRVTYLEQGGILVEGIGSILSFHLDGGTLVDIIEPFFICYSENGNDYIPVENFEISIASNCVTATSTTEPHINPYPISPNPTDDLLSVQFPEEIQPTQLIVTDISGRVVHQYSDWQSGTPLQVGMLPSGMYFLVAEDRSIGWRGVWKFVRH